MEGESSENRFVERRSAYIDDDEEEKRTSPAEAIPEIGAVAGAEAGRREEAVGAEASDAETAVEGEAPRSADLDLDEMERVEIPEPSFYEIVQPLEIQALQFLGELPLTSEGQRRVLPRWAKHVIDLLGILDERTRGNLRPEEAQYLEQVLTDLRMRYLRVAS